MLDDIKDALITKCITKKLIKPKLQNEWSLCSDYHLYDATMVFSDEYVKAYRHYYTQIWDHLSGPWRRGYTGHLFDKKSAALTGFWKARTICDEMQVSYKFFAWRAVEWHAKRNFNHLPRPVNLYRPDTLEHIAERWELEKNVTYFKGQQN